MLAAPCGRSEREEAKCSEHQDPLPLWSCRGVTALSLWQAALLEELFVPTVREEVPAQLNGEFGRAAALGRAARTEAAPSSQPSSAVSQRS